MMYSISHCHFCVAAVTVQIRWNIWLILVTSHRAFWACKERWMDKRKKNEKDPPVARASYVCVCARAQIRVPPIRKVCCAGWFSSINMPIGCVPAQNQMVFKYSVLIMIFTYIKIFIANAIDDVHQWRPFHLNKRPWIDCCRVSTHNQNRLNQEQKPSIKCITSIERILMNYNRYSDR